MKFLEPEARSASERKLVYFGMALESAQVRKERERGDCFMFVQATFTLHRYSLEQNQKCY